MAQQHPENPWGTTGFEPGGTRGEAWNLGYDVGFRDGEEESKRKYDELRQRMNDVLEVLKFAYLPYIASDITAPNEARVEESIRAKLIEELGMQFRRWEQDYKGF